MCILTFLWDNSIFPSAVCQSIIKHYEKDQVLIQSLGHTIVQPEHFTPRRRRACMNNYKYGRYTIIDCF